MNGLVRKQILKWDGEPVLALSLRRPDLSSCKRPVQAIDRYYQQLSDTWRCRWENDLLSQAAKALQAARADSRPFKPWSATLDFTVTHEDESVLSLYLDAMVQGFTAHPLIVRSADTWDLTTGMPHILSAFLPSALKKRTALLSFLKQQAAIQRDGGESLFFEDVETRIESEFCPDRFYLTDGRLILFYPMLALGSAAERIPIFSLS